jgi:RHS repeat-associated protein
MSGAPARWRAQQRRRCASTASRCARVQSTPAQSFSQAALPQRWRGAPVRPRTRGLPRCFIALLLAAAALSAKGRCRLHRARASAKLASTQKCFTTGRAVFVSCPQVADASTQNAPRYDEWASGGSFDRETNLNYNTLRDGYDPAVGRYTQADPVGLTGGINPYLYVDANPLRKVDPLGLAGIVVGVSGNGFVGTMGLGGGSALVFDPANGNICYQAQICTRAGLGLAFTVTANLGLNTGPICPGTTSSAGLFGTGGAGLAGLGSVRASTTGSGGSVTSGALGGLGAGWGMAGGGEACYTTLVCLKEPECCKCGNCGSSSAGGSIGSITAP